MLCQQDPLKLCQRWSVGWAAPCVAGHQACAASDSDVSAPSWGVTGGAIQAQPRSALATSGRTPIQGSAVSCCARPSFPGIACCLQESLRAFSCFHRPDQRRQRQFEAGQGEKATVGRCRTPRSALNRPTQRPMAQLASTCHTLSGFSSLSPYFSLFLAPHWFTPTYTDFQSDLNSTREPTGQK